MEQILEKLYTFADTIMQFFSWIYNSAVMVGDYISEQWYLIIDLCSSVPEWWSFGIAAMAAAALLYLVLGR